MASKTVFDSTNASLSVTAVHEVCHIYEAFYLDLGLADTPYAMKRKGVPNSFYQVLIMS